MDISVGSGFTCHCLHNSNEITIWFGIFDREIDRKCYILFTQVRSVKIFSLI